MENIGLKDYFYTSPIGWLRITADSKGVYAVCVTAMTADVVLQPPKASPADTTFRWLDAYFQGNKSEPPLPPLHVTGTDFQQQVWNEITSIPRGCAITYGTLADRLASLRGCQVMSAQAVGQAVKRNRHLILIPCHRVVAANGIGGYTCGLHIKRWLLAHEGLKL